MELSNTTEPSYRFNPHVFAEALCGYNFGSCWFTKAADIVIAHESRQCAYGMQKLLVQSLYIAVFEESLASLLKNMSGKLYQRVFLTEVNIRPETDGE